MEFIKYKRFGEPYWFCGIYKISRYSWYKGSNCAPYYHAYKLINKQWGDFVGGKPAQHDKQLTFDQAVALCVDHAKTYTPSSKELKNAEEGRIGWLSIDPSFSNAA